MSIFITNDIIRDNISQSISEYWNEKVGIGVPQSLLAGSGPGHTGAAPLHGKKDVVWQNIQSVYEMEPQMESDAEKRRRSIRLKYRDYTLPGPYFVTICGHEKRCVFGSIVGARLAPSELGSSFESVGWQFQGTFRRPCFMNL